MPCMRIRLYLLTCRALVRPNPATSPHRSIAHSGWSCLYRRLLRLCFHVCASMRAMRERTGRIRGSAPSMSVVEAIPRESKSQSKVVARASSRARVHMSCVQVCSYVASGSVLVLCSSRGACRECEVVRSVGSFLSQQCLRHLL